MLKKKSQGATEFLLVLVFVLIIISLIMYVVGNKAVDFQREKDKADIDNFAESILTEIKILQKMEGGYLRKVEIPKHFMKKYNLTLNANKSYFTLVNTEIVINLSENIHYYEFSEGLNISFSNETGIYILTLSKEKIDLNENKIEI